MFIYHVWQIHNAQYSKMLRSVDLSINQQYIATRSDRELLKIHQVAVSLAILQLFLENVFAETDRDLAFSNQSRSFDFCNLTSSQKQRVLTTTMIEIQLYRNRLLMSNCILQFIMMIIENCYFRRCIHLSQHDLTWKWLLLLHLAVPILFRFDPSAST